jgi:hypothetical protein
MRYGLLGAIENIADSARIYWPAAISSCEKGRFFGPRGFAQPLERARRVKNGQK